MTPHPRSTLLVWALTAWGVACDPSVSPILPPNVALLPCTPTLDPQVLARFDFEGLLERRPLVEDATGRHPATWQGGMPFVVEGPEGCGEALGFAGPGTPGGYVEVPDAPAWQLDEGAVDFWFWADSCAADEAGVITRDAEFTQLAGHFRVFWRNDCRLAARTQVAGENDAQASVEVATSNPLPLGRWNHFAVNFGAPGLELWLNGDRVGFGPTLSGLRGNANPWTIGISNDRSAEGTSAPTWKPLHDAAVDRVRIWSSRRSFAPP